MHRIFFFSLILIFSSFDSFGQTIDSNESKVTFSVRNIKFNTVKGSFTGMKGGVTFLPDDLASSKFEVCIDAASINTGSKKRDNHLRNEDFFDVDKYPEICFESSEIIKTSSGYKAKGILTMHGFSRNVEIPFSYKNKQFIGNLKVKRLDYHVGEETGEFMVSNEIAIQIICSLN